MKIKTNIIIILIIIIVIMIIGQKEKPTNKEKELMKKKTAINIEINQKTKQNKKIINLNKQPE